MDELETAERHGEAYYAPFSSTKLGKREFVLSCAPALDPLILDALAAARVSTLLHNKRKAYTIAQRKTYNSTASQF
jgi:hypothetical protein